MVFCCGPCGDRECGGIELFVRREEGAYVWHFPSVDEQNPDDVENIWGLVTAPHSLTFRFEEGQYRALFESYLASHHKKALV